MGNILPLFWLIWGLRRMKGRKIIEAVSSIYPPSRLQVGNSYAAITDSASAVKYVVFEKSRTGYAVVDLNENTISVYDYTKPVTLKRAYAEGTITSSLWNAIIDTGAPALPALKLYDVSPWQIDFFDINKGRFVPVNV